MSGPLLYVPLASLEGAHSSGVAAVAFSPNGLYLATAGLDCKLCVWKLSDQEIFHSFSCNSPILSLAWLPDSDSTLIFGAQDGSISTLELDLVTCIVRILDGDSYSYSSANLFVAFGHTGLE